MDLATPLQQPFGQFGNVTRRAAATRLDDNGDAQR